MSKRTKRSDFPSEDNLPTTAKELYLLLQEAQSAKLSYRYTNVVRHRLMDRVMDQINEGRL